MRWVLRLMVVASVLLFQPWEARSALSSSGMYLRMIGVILMPLAGGLWVLYSWRTAAYERWNRPPRWAFLALLSTLTAFGAGAFLYVKVGDLGIPAMTWFIVAPIIFGLLNWRPIDALRPGHRGSRGR